MVSKWYYQPALQHVGSGILIYILSLRATRILFGLHVLATELPER